MIIRYSDPWGKADQPGSASFPCRSIKSHRHPCKILNTEAGAFPPKGTALA